MTGMPDTPPLPPGQLSLDGPAGDLDARTAQLRAQLDQLDAAKLAARAESLDAVAASAATSTAAGRALDDAVTEARAYGATWEQIGTAAGMTRQAAWERWATRG